MRNGSAPEPTIVPTPSEEEAAAIVAAIECFMRATAPAAHHAAADATDRWHQVAILEGVARAERDDFPDPWINP